MKQCVNKSFACGEFLDCLKQANVSPIFKKDDPLDNENYRPASILPLLSKKYEKFLYNQLFHHVENIFNVILCNFRKAHSTQRALFKLLQSWQEELDEKSIAATVLMDLSKAYEYIPHDLFIAKLNSYGIESMGLLLISDYLSPCKQRTKIGSSYYSSWHDIIRRVPKGFLLGPLHFNIFINDLFLFIRKFEVCNFADDYILDSVGKNVEYVKTGLVGLME